MREKLGSAGSLAAALGVLVCLAAVAGRFYGEKAFIGFQAINIFMVGVGLMVMGSWLKLESRD